MEMMLLFYPQVQCQDKLVKRVGVFLCVAKGSCTDIKATVAEKTLLATFISVVCIVYMSLLDEVLLHEELCYLSVFT